MDRNSIADGQWNYVQLQLQGKRNCFEGKGYSISVSVGNAMNGNSIVVGQWKCVHHLLQVFCQGKERVGLGWDLGQESSCAYVCVSVCVMFKIKED